MTSNPSLPGWEGIHPALVHFPIALLLVAPALLLVSLFARQSWRSWAAAALIVMSIGTVASWLAVASGHAAGQLVDKTRDLERAIGAHEGLAVTTRNVFTALTLLYALLVTLRAPGNKPLPPALRVTLHAVFLALFLGGTLVLAGTASRGGRLVHELGVRAMVEAVPPAPAEDTRAR